MPVSMRWIVAAVSAAIVVAIASLAVSIAALTGGSTAPSAAARNLPISIGTGVYSNGRSTVPHHFVIIDDVESHTLSGSMNLRYQDGQSSVIFDFVGEGIHET